MAHCRRSRMISAAERVILFERSTRTTNSKDSSIPWGKYVRKIPTRITEHGGRKTSAKPTVYNKSIRSYHHSLNIQTGVMHRPTSLALKLKHRHQTDETSAKPRSETRTMAKIFPHNIFLPLSQNNCCRHDSKSYKAHAHRSTLT